MRFDPPLPIDAYCIGSDFEDVEARFEQSYGISSAGASLVRPDGFVAWRSESAAADATALVHEALRQSLGHGPVSRSE
jgi:aklavinone 12-hydroxylase